MIIHFELIFYKVQDLSQNSIFCLWIFVCGLAPFVEKAVLPPFNYWCTFVKNKLATSPLAKIRGQQTGDTIFLEHRELFVYVLFVHCLWLLSCYKSRIT